MRYSDLKIARHGDLALIQGGDFGAIILTNSAGAIIAEGMRDDVPDTCVIDRLEDATGLPQDMARQLRFDLTASWEAAGLFAPNPLAALDIPTVSIDASPDLLVGMPARHVRIQCACPVLLKQLRALLAPLIDSADGSSTGQIAIHRLENGDYLVLENGDPVWMPANLDEARFLTARSVARLLHGPDRIGVVLHGGAIAGQDGCLIFTAASGSGKTTLIASLVAAGYAYMADDQVPVDRSGAQALPCPTCLGLKPGAVTLPHLAALVAQTRLPDPTPRKDVTFLALPGLSLDSDPLPVRAVILPHYDPNGENRVEPLPFETALRAVLLSGAEVTRDAAMLPALAGLLRDRPVLRLHYRDTAFALAECNRLMPCNRI